MVKPMYGGKVKQPVHYFTRFQDGGTISTTAATANTFGVIYWEFTSIPGYAEFTSMYDFYKINAVQVRFIPVSNQTISVDQTTYAANTTSHYNRLITVLDYNDRTVPTSLNDLRQYSNCKVSPGNFTHKRFIHPKPTISIDEDSASSNQLAFGQLPGKNPWLATNGATNVEHYGIKFGIEHPSIASNSYPLYKVEFRVYLSFKGRN